MLVVYFSSVSETTKRFVEKLPFPNKRIPLYTKDDTITVSEPFVLVVPTYAGGRAGGGAVPRQVIKFLNVESNRNQIQAVVGTGNTNFGKEYGAAARIVAKKTQVPLLGYVELLGTPEEVTKITKRIRGIHDED